MRILINKNGMTLVELIIAVALLGIISTMVIIVISTGLFITSDANDNELQTNIAVTSINEQFLETPNGSSVQVSVLYNGVTTDLPARNINGKIAEATSTSLKNSTTIKAFVPNGL